MKKILFWLLVTLWLSWGLIWLTNAQQNYWNTNWEFGQMWSVGWIWVAWTDNAQDWGWADLIDIIKRTINWLLSMLWLIALVILLYWWFKMVTAAWDETKYKEWFKILKYAAGWLVFIALSFFMVSWIFWLISTVSWWTWA